MYFWGKLKKIVWFMWALLRTYDVYWAKVLTEFFISPSAVQRHDQKTKLILNELNLTIEKRSCENILKAYDKAVRIYRTFGCEFNMENQDYLINICGIRFGISDAQVLQIVSEVFVDGMYDVDFSEEAIVIDIGMNVGIVSLYLAKRLNCNVYAFEPFHETFELALKNFDRNQEISTRIRAFNYGMGSKTRKIKALYCRESSGDCGIIPIPAEYRGDYQTEYEEISIKPIGAEIDKIIRENPAKRIIVKIDCEGSEYEIVEALCSGGYMKKISVLMMEWHSRAEEHDPNILIRMLTDNLFISFHRGNLREKVGMIYAVNKDLPYQ